MKKISTTAGRTLAAFISSTAAAAVLLTGCSSASSPSTASSTSSIGSASKETSPVPSAAPDTTASTADSSAATTPPATKPASSLAGKRLGVSVCCPVAQIDVIANTLTANVAKNGTGLTASVVNGQSSTQKANQDVQSFLAQGYNGIWTTLISGQGYDSLAKQAASQKIPWVNFSGSAVTGATLNIVIPESQLGYSIGTATAQWMVAHGQQSAAIGATIDSSGANADRTNGFVAGVHAQMPDVKVYTVGNVASTTTAAATIGANLLQAHPEIKVFFGWVADDGVGLLQAAREAGNTDPNKFLVTTDEGNAQVYQLIATKSLLQIGASLGYPFGVIEGENLLEQAMNGQTIPTTAIMRPTLVIPSNVALVQKQEADPYAYPDRIKTQLAFTKDVLSFGQLPKEQVTPVTP